MSKPKGCSCTRTPRPNAEAVGNTRLYQATQGLGERQVRITLTEAGQKLDWRVSEIVRCASGLQGNQRKELTEKVNALRRALESRHAQWIMRVDKAAPTDAWWSLE